MGGIDAGDGTGYASGSTELVVIGILALAIVLIALMMLRSMRRISVPRADEGDPRDPDDLREPDDLGNPDDLRDEHLRTPDDEDPMDASAKDPEPTDPDATDPGSPGRPLA